MALERNDAKVMNYVQFKAGAPTNEVAAKGTIVIDTTNGKVYVTADGAGTWIVLGSQT